jgi:hypothetical protein
VDDDPNNAALQRLRFYVDANGAQHRVDLSAPQRSIRYLNCSAEGELKHIAK